MTKHCKDLSPNFKAVTERPYRDPPNKKKIKELSRIFTELYAFEIWHHTVGWGVRLYLTYDERHYTGRQSSSTRVEQKKDGGAGPCTFGDIGI